MSAQPGDARNLLVSAEDQLVTRAEELQGGIQLAREEQNRLDRELQTTTSAIDAEEARVRHLESQDASLERDLDGVQGELAAVKAESERIMAEMGSVVAGRGVDTPGAEHQSSVEYPRGGGDLMSSLSLPRSGWDPDDSFRSSTQSTSPAPQISEIDDQIARPDLSGPSDFITQEAEAILELNLPYLLSQRDRSIFIITHKRVHEIARQYNLVSREDSTSQALQDLGQSVPVHLSFPFQYIAHQITVHPNDVARFKLKEKIPLVDATTERGAHLKIIEVLKAGASLLFSFAVKGRPTGSSSQFKCHPTILGADYRRLAHLLMPMNDAYLECMDGRRNS